MGREIKENQRHGLIRIGDEVKLILEHDEAGFDTKVSVSEGFLCWVSTLEKNEFIEELEKIIEKYRI